METWLRDGEQLQAPSKMRLNLVFLLDETEYPYKNVDFGEEPKHWNTWSDHQQKQWVDAQAENLNPRLRLYKLAKWIRL